jgi:hypothetical protein
MKKINILPLFAAIIFFSSCESMVTNVNIEDSDPKLVINAFLNPMENNIIVSVSESSPLFDTIDDNWEIPYLDNADVFISNGTLTKQLSYDAQQKHYFISTSAFPLAVGMTCTIKVKTPDQREAEGITTLPAMINHNIRLESVTKVTNENYTENVLKFRFDDPAGEKNYYRILATVTWENLNQPGDTFMEALNLDGRSEFLSDVNFDGSNHLITFTAWDNTGYKLKSVYAHFLTTDAAYYHYHRSLENYNNSGGNPFAEPVVIYSNIEKGRGIVASFNQQIIDCTIP